MKKIVLNFEPREAAMILARHGLRKEITERAYMAIVMDRNMVVQKVKVVVEIEEIERIGGEVDVEDGADVSSGS